MAGDIDLDPDYQRGEIERHGNVCDWHFLIATVHSCGLARNETNW